MLPLWRERIGVEISPQRVAWVRMARGWRANVIAKGCEHISPQQNEPLWIAALSKVEQLMRGEDWKRAEVTVVLSNHFVRYDCLPWNSAVSDEAERIALAQHRLAQVYGAGAQAQAVRISPAGKGAPRLIAAMDTALLEKLRRIATETDCKLHSIQPYVMTSFNRFAKGWSKNEGWFVAAEKGRFALALFRAGQWQRIQLRRGVGMASLHEWLERENLAGGEAFCREVYLFGPELERDATMPSYHLHRLELPACRGYSPLTDMQYALAMSGVA